jgi:hypothetical protein
VAIAILVTGIATPGCSERVPSTTSVSANVIDDHVLVAARSIANKADRLELTMVYSSQQEMRRVGPIVTDDQEIITAIRNAFRKTSPLEENPLRLSNTLSGNYLEIEMVCTKEQMSERIRMFGNDWIAIGRDERYRVWVPESVVWDVCKEWAEKQDYLPWLTDK